MYIDRSRVKGPNGTVYTRYLLRESYREDGKVKNRTLGNLSSCSQDVIAAIRAALKNPDSVLTILSHAGVEVQATRGQKPKPDANAEPGKLTTIGDEAIVGNHSHVPSRQTVPVSSEPSSLPLKQGPSIGAVLVLEQLAQELGIVDALGSKRDGKLALWQIMARAIEQGSRLSAVRLARDLRVGEVLGLPSFDEDDLYANLAWLSANQDAIEKFLHDRLIRLKPESLTSDDVAQGLYLYDVTSTYLEGEHNAFAAFGYNRDGKKGKKQIVIGLLCTASGEPIAIKVFKGNTSDPKTVASQVHKLQEDFGAKHITLVGDRGMIRGPQIEHLQAVGMHYITAISKPQIETLIEASVLNMDLFAEELGEVIEPTNEDGGKTAERYIMRRNPVRQAECEAIRESKHNEMARAVQQANEYLAAGAKRQAAVQLKHIEQRIKRLGLSDWLKAETSEVEPRSIILRTDKEAKAEAVKLDGCYVIKTDLTVEQMGKAEVHQRYKDLNSVECAFRRSKSVELELRPVHVRRAESTQGHVLVVMLSYLLMRELGQRWSQVDMTVGEGLSRLNTYCAVETQEGELLLLEPRADVASLVNAARVKLPRKLSTTKRKSIHTKTKLPQRRPKRRK